MKTIYQLEEIYKDGFEVTFETEKEQQDFLTDIENKSSWFRVPTKELEVVYAEDAYGDDVVMEDTRGVQGTELAIKAEGITYPLASTALTTLYSRMGIKGPVIRQWSKQVLAEVLTLCAPVRKGEALLYLESGKIRACHGGDKSDYAILPMRNLFLATKQELASYENSTYISGNWNHSYMNAKWSIHDKEVAKAYAEIYDEMFIPIDEESVKTTVSLASSDTASSGATLWYTVESDNTRLVIGRSDKLDHRNGATIADFKDILSGTFSGYKKAFDNIKKLQDIEIEHPLGCIINMCKKADLPAALYMKAVDEYEATIGDAPTTALNVYVFGINGVLEQANKANATVNDILTYTEKIARCLSMSFKANDKRVEVK